MDPAKPVTRLRRGPGGGPGKTSCKIAKGGWGGGPGKTSCKIAKGGRSGVLKTRCRLNCEFPPIPLRELCSR